MSRLFIVGNGFDLAHNIGSRYEDFRHYLISELEKETGKSYSTYDFTDTKIFNADYHPSKKDNILIIMHLIEMEEYHLRKDKKDCLWKDVETSVGRFDYNVFKDLFIDEGDGHESRSNAINECIFEPYIEVVNSIKEYFAEWARQIDINHAINYRLEEFSKLIEPDSKFLCFNYTNTLEKVYGINRKNIRYIHGNAIRGTEIQFGHGNKLDYHHFLEQLHYNYFSVAEGVNSINNHLRKPVSKIINNNYKYFKGLSLVDEIYSFGFSFADVDIPYLKKIKKYTKSNISCNILCTQSGKKIFPTIEESESYASKLKVCGYVGPIETLLIKG